MVVWTVLDEKDNEYQQLRDNGYLICDPTHPGFMLNDSDFKDCSDAYNWMATQLRRKTNSWKNLWYNFKYSINKIQYPRWIWYKIEGSTNPLQVDKVFYSAKPGNYRILVFDIDPSLVLLSDFDAWHYVLNYWHFSYTEEEYNSWEEYLKRNNIKDIYLRDANYISQLSPNQKKLVSIIQKQIIDSWQGIFDLDNTSEFAFGKLNDRTIQGVTWVLRKKDFRFSYNITITQNDIDEYYKKME